MELNINFIAVVACVLLSFILDFVWYAALFMKPWTKEMGYDPSMRPDNKQMMKGMTVSVIGNFQDETKNENNRICILQN
jgi:hypothetical protein